jgi:hypothetical protein
VLHDDLQATISQLRGERRFTERNPFSPIATKSCQALNSLAGVCAGQLPRDPHFCSSTTSKRHRSDRRRAFHFLRTALPAQVPRRRVAGSVKSWRSAHASDDAHRERCRHQGSVNADGLCVDCVDCGDCDDC